MRTVSWVCAGGGASGVTTNACTLPSSCGTTSTSWFPAVTTVPPWAGAGASMAIDDGTCCATAGSGASTSASASAPQPPSSDALRTSAPNEL